jgi:hypothetical protein
MTLARLLAALVMCSLPAFAQDHLKLVRPPENLFSLPCWIAPSTPAEPWKIIPNRPAHLGSEENPLSHIRTDQYRLGQSEADCTHLSVRSGHLDAITTGPNKILDSDTTCYTIRSYVVARDSKDSDSTHRVSYSTCQPAARYQLKTTEMRSVTLYP